MNTKDLDIIEKGLRGEYRCSAIPALEVVERLRKELEGKDTPEPTEADLRASYLEGQAKCGLKVGDTVRITRIARDFEGGWKMCWADEMDSLIGKKSIIQMACSDEGLQLMNGFRLPYFVLEKVEKKRIPLEMKDWAGGPWWVRQPGSYWVKMVVGVSPDAICLGMSGRFGFTDQTLERSTDLENWKPCYKEIEQ